MLKIKTSTTLKASRKGLRTQFSVTAIFIPKNFRLRLERWLRG